MKLENPCWDSLLPKHVLVHNFFIGSSSYSERPSAFPSELLRAFCWLGKPPAMTEKVLRKRALTSRIERSEQLTSNLAGLYKLEKKRKCPFMCGGAVDARDRIFSASLDARR